MQLLFIAASLLSAVAARPDSWRPWQDEKFPPTGGPKLDADSQRGDDEQSVTQAPEDGDGGSVGDWPEWDSGHPVWLHEMPPWLPNRPSRRPGNENPCGHTKRTDGNDRQPGRPSQVSTRGKRQAPGFMHDEPEVPHPGASRHFGRPNKGPPRGRWPNRRNPEAMVFSSVFKVDNVTFQNVTDVPLKEGENIFLMPKHSGRGPHHHKRGKHGPPKNGQYVKLIYNATEPNNVAIEYGVLKPMNLAEIVGEEDNPEEYYW
ncbi:uncharacterized protein [Enoplosus armatus]|uniref:uncharacterized protein n=1 Tax=Enoplosus armatus TaxID=215367 RepID=UPI00399270B6